MSFNPNRYSHDAVPHHIPCLYKPLPYPLTNPYPSNGFSQAQYDTLLAERFTITDKNAHAFVEADSSGNLYQFIITATSNHSVTLLVQHAVLSTIVLNSPYPTLHAALTAYETAAVLLIHRHANPQ